jgi:arylsulfatase A-like enzyme
VGERAEGRAPAAVRALRGLVRGFLLTLLLAACSAPSPRPSVLLITVDTLRPDHLSSYGYPRETSPSIDALAASGLLFEEVRSHAPVTAPSHASILSGDLPAWHQVLTNGDVLNARVETLATWLGAAGLATAAFVSNAAITRPLHFGQGFGHFDDILPEREANRPQPERIAAHTVDAALAWLGKHHAAPFFCWVHLEDPHGPYTPPAEHAAPFLAAAAKLPVVPVPILADQSGRGGIPRYQALAGETNREVYVARYDSEIHYMDLHIGRLLAALREWGVEPLVVLTADHGEALGEHGYYFAHGQGLTEDQIRVPLILRGPGVPEGERSRRPVDHLDIAPTVLAWTGVAATRALPGRNLLALPEGSHTTVSQGFPMRASITVEGMKLVRRPGMEALFDLRVDPGEERDVAAAEPDARQRLGRLLEAELARRQPGWGRASALGPVLEDQLRQLGYAE